MTFKDNLRSLLKNKFAWLLIGFFLFLTLWRVLILFIPAANDTANWSNVGYSLFYWGTSYQIIAWIGAIYGIFISRLWGGTKSTLGKASLAFAMGLLAQSFGQIVSAFYVFKDLSVPYPSLGDVGFFGSILFYTYAILLLGKIIGGKFSGRMKSMAVFVPLIMLAISSFTFLRGYEFGQSGILKPFLDWGYPLGQAFYVSMALLFFFSSRRVLGGIMRFPSIFLICALIVQFFADFSFLFTTSRGLYIPGVSGSYVDFIYLTAYFLMSLSLVQLSVGFNKIKNS